MRRLPRKRTDRQSLIIQAVEEWFGEMNSAESKSSVSIALWLMGRRKGVSLTKEEEEVVWMVQQNLKAGVGFQNAL